jgi:hypothetical protein
MKPAMTSNSPYMTAAPMPGAGGGLIGLPDFDGIKDNMFPNGVPGLADLMKKNKADKRAEEKAAAKPADGATRGGGPGGIG